MKEGYVPLRGRSVGNDAFRCLHIKVTLYDAAVLIERVPPSTNPSRDSADEPNPDFKRRRNYLDIDAIAARLTGSLILSAGNVGCESLGAGRPGR